MNIGIIGVGGAGRAHARRFRRESDINFIYGFDIKSIDSKEVEMIYSFEEFLINVDVISICSPDSTHYDYIKKGIEAGKHVLVEKPMVTSVAEAKSLEATINLAALKELVFAVHHQMRFVPCFEYAKDLIDEGKFGDVFYIEANYWHDMRKRNTKFDNWRVREGQSVIFGAACHPLDLIIYLLGEEPIENKCITNKVAYPEYPLDYTASTSIHHFKSGVVAKCHTNNCAVFPQFNNLIVLGEKASFVDGVIYDKNGFEIRDFDVTGVSADLKSRVLKNLFDSLLNFFARRKKIRTSPITVYDHDKACQKVIRNFVNSIKGLEEPLVGYKDANAVIELCENLENVK